MTGFDLGAMPLNATLLLGGVLLSLYQFGRQVLDWVQVQVRRRFTSSFTVLSTEYDMFFWLSAWVQHHLPAARHLTVQATLYGDDERVHYAPADGTYFLRVAGVPLWVERFTTEGKQNNSKPIHTIKLTALGRQTALFTGIIDEGRRLTAPKPNTIEISQTAAGWREVLGREQKRSFDTVVLDGGAAAALLADVDAFLASRARYEALGIPYRRGYLLHGPPGNGKTTLIKAVASHYDLPVCLLNLASKDINDANLVSILSRLTRGIVVLEDVDAVLHGRNVQGRPADSGLTFSGVLNALDGILAPEGRLLFMTTNHPEVLDPALVRPGRIDYRLELANASTSQLLDLFERFYPSLYAYCSADFGSRLTALPERVLSVATAQDALLAAEGKPEPHEAALQALEAYVAHPPEPEPRYVGAPAATTSNARPPALAVPHHG